MSAGLDVLGERTFSLRQTVGAGGALTGHPPHLPVRTKSDVPQLRQTDDFSTSNESNLVRAERSTGGDSDDDGTAPMGFGPGVGDDPPAKAHVAAGGLRVRPGPRRLRG